MSKDSHTTRCYEFRDFVLDTGRGELRRNGEPVPLRPQSFEVLAFLIANQGRLVTKETLHETIWAGKAVTDDSVTQCLIDIRKAVGDSDRTMVKTLPRRGYLFDEPVAVHTIGELPTAANVALPKWALPLGVVVVLALAVLWLADSGEQRRTVDSLDRSIAVLPFVDLSESQDQQYLGDGLSADIASAIAQNPRLNVIARTSSFALVRENRDIAYIRDVLGVEFVLEGTVRRSGNTVRITTQLIDTRDSTQVWSQPFETTFSELLSVQQFVSERVQTSMLPDEPAMVAEPPRRNVSANQLLLLARDLERQVREQSIVDEDLLQQAIDLYREATQADPGSALAHSRLAGALLYAGDVNAAEPAILRALSLNPELSEVQETVGRFYWARNLPDAGAAWLRAIELNPNNADALSSYGYWRWLRVESEGPGEYFARALALDPLSLSRYADAGYHLANQGQVAETEAMIERVTAMFDSTEAYRLIAQLKSLIGKTDESIGWTLRALELEPDNRLYRSALAELYADLGDFESALAIENEPSLGLLLKMSRYDEFIDEAEFAVIDEPGDIYLRYLLAYAYNVVGRANDAVRLLLDAGIHPDWTNNARQMIDIEAALVLADALHASGQIERGRSAAESWLSESHTDSPNWWVHVYSACALAVLDRDEEAFYQLELVRQSPRLPWRHLITDSRCFRKYEDMPRFDSLLSHVDERLAEVRARLPATLAAMGVSEIH